MVGRGRRVAGGERRKAGGAACSGRCAPRDADLPGRPAPSQADLVGPPPTLATCMTGFVPPPASADDLAARASANAVRHALLYAWTLAALGAVASVRSLKAELAHGMLCAAVCLCNDGGAAAASAAVARAARVVHPPTAARLRAAAGATAGLGGAPHGRSRLTVAGVPRARAAAGLAGGGILLLWAAGAAAARRALLALAFGAALVALHAACKRPDLKPARARRVGAGDAPQAVWRGSAPATISPRGAGGAAAPGATPNGVSAAPSSQAPPLPPPRQRHDYTL